MLNYARFVWHWSAIDGLPVVMAINIVVFVCAIALAIHACWVARRLKNLGLAHQRNATLIGKLMKEIDGCITAIESRSGALPVAKNGPGHAAETSAVPDLREEIELLHEEISAMLKAAPSEQDSSDAAQILEIESFTQQARDEIEGLRNELAMQEELLGKDG